MGERVLVPQGVLYGLSLLRKTHPRVDWEAGGYWNAAELFGICCCDEAVVIIATICCTAVNWCVMRITYEHQGDLFFPQPRRWFLWIAESCLCHLFSLLYATHHTATQLFLFVILLHLHACLEQETSPLSALSPEILPSLFLFCMWWRPENSTCKILISTKWFRNTGPSDFPWDLSP